MDLRYPIGKYEPKPFSNELKAERLADIQFLAGLLERAVENLDEHQLNTPYREGGWTVKQVVHHVADSHMNALSRLKFVLTEENPTIMGYDERAWAQTAEYSQLPINVSLTMIHTIQQKLFVLYSNVKDDEWNRTYIHSHSKKQFDLWYLMGMYAWHGKHHVAHITSLRERMGW
ncbi:MAG: putative metal-dependent hydrolase [Chitinophagaceae bacterium]|nr:putative metal-dependent hydrolase [Chitinophagaceae bacterium]